MTTMYKYRFLCNTESALKEVWKTDADAAPTLCPDNTGHTVDLDTMVVSEVLHDDIQKTQVMQTNKIASENAGTCVAGIKMVVANGVNPTLFSFCKGYDFDVVSGRIYTLPKKGDIFSAYVLPKGDTAVGTITANAEVNDTEIEVSSTVINLSGVKPGAYISFASEDYEEMYEVVAVNAVDSKLEIDGSIATQHLSGTGVYIRFPAVHRAEFEDDTLFDSMSNALNAMGLAKELEIKFVYKHATAPTAAGAIRGHAIYKY